VKENKEPRRCAIALSSHYFVVAGVVLYGCLCRETGQLRGGKKRSRAAWLRVGKGSILGGGRGGTVSANRMRKRF